jgi:hypothetical protein
MWGFLAPKLDYAATAKLRAGSAADSVSLSHRLERSEGTAKGGIAPLQRFCSVPKCRLTSVCFPRS